MSGPLGGIADLKRRIRALDGFGQTALAIELATLLLPFAELCEAGQPAGGLASVSQQVRAATTPAALDRARELLMSIPELSDDDEPNGLAWFALGATVTWIYAADSRSTRPADGAANAFDRALDVLDEADEVLGGGDLVLRLLTELGSALDDGGPVAVSPELHRDVRSAAERVGRALDAVDNAVRADASTDG